MSDITALRKDIKTWERNFKSENGRDASIQDIKDQPSIAEKYKLYKKLSKAAAIAVSFNTSTPSNIPSTPPRSQPSLILSSQRAIEPTGPLSSFNPFSPVKNKGNHNVIVEPTSGAESRSNPFVTPIKGKSKSKTVDNRELSPDPFPPIQPSQSQVPISNLKPPAHASALSRARKRLRGEPVSPSPNKEKRRRIASPTSLPLMRTNSQLASSDNENDPDAGEANSSFVDDSPVKVPVGGKPFRLLFEEAVPFNAGPTEIKKTFSKPTVESGHFGNPPAFGNAGQTFTANSGVGGDRRKKATNEKPSVPSRKGPSKDDPFSDSGVPPQESSEVAVPGPSGLHSEPRTSAKHFISDTELEQNEAVTSAQLLPPSPPSVDPYPPAAAKYKGKEKAKGVGRKKVKVVKEGDSKEDDESEDNSNLKVVCHNHRPQHKHAEDDQDLDLGSILRFRTHRRPRGTPPIDQPDDMSKFEVDLPDRMRSVLAISPSKPRDSKGERVVRGLIYGERPSHYDPSKGGEIWGVGELDDEGQGGNTEEEDDWEGEPVPWEVGEL